MKKLRATNRFKKDKKRMDKRGGNSSKLRGIILHLQNDTPLPQSARAHKLEGEWKGFWECHIEPDWLLIYDVTEDVVLLAATGTHADLFR